MLSSSFFRDIANVRKEIAWRTEYFMRKENSAVWVVKLSRQECSLNVIFPIYIISHENLFSPF